MKYEKLLLWLGLLIFSWWSVYTRYVDLHGFDLVTNMPFRDLSLEQYEDRNLFHQRLPGDARVVRRSRGGAAPGVVARGTRHLLHRMGEGNGAADRVCCSSMSSGSGLTWGGAAASTPSSPRSPAPSPATS
ncbi:MAG: hypothetical protein Q7R30_17455 [Acidobacteriota bacterium]|nr:hypothetical protein [Acidobacteriota bacterium]